MSLSTGESKHSKKYLDYLEQWFLNMKTIPRLF